MKIAIIGGGSFGTPALFRALAAYPMADCEFTLIGRSAANLASVARAARLLAGPECPKIETCLADANSAGIGLRGSAVVIVQIRPGGLRGRAWDESFPLAFGLCGDEGLGAGGLSAGWRAWPEIEAWLTAIEQHAPGALVVMLSSPVGILTRAALARFPAMRCVGICELPLATLEQMCTALGVAMGEVAMGYCGINHLGWLHSLSCDNRDLVREWAATSGDCTFPDRALIERWHAVPLKYLRLHFETAAVVLEQRSASISRAAELQRIGAAAYHAFADGDLETIHEALNLRDTPWYKLAVAPLLAALHLGDGAGPFFMTCANRGAVPELEPDEVIEQPYSVVEGRLQQVQSKNPPPAEVVKLVGDFCRAEAIATEAILTGNEARLAEAIAAHPWLQENQQRSLLLPLIIRSGSTAEHRTAAGRACEVPHHDIEGIPPVLIRD